MILVDTDHLTVLARPDDSRHALGPSRIREVTEQTVGVAIISAEEQLRGWLAAIRKVQNVAQQVIPYQRFTDLIRYLNAWPIIPFDNHAAEAFARLRRQKIRIGTQDLKIASIAITNDALLLSANLSDFTAVPGLRVENWLK